MPSSFSHSSVVDAGYVLLHIFALVQRLIHEHVVFNTVGKVPEVCALQIFLLKVVAYVRGTILHSFVQLRLDEEGEVFVALGNLILVKLNEFFDFVRHFFDKY